MPFSTTQRFMSLGMPTLLAKELGTQLDTGVYNWQRLQWSSMPPELARYLTASLTAGVFNAPKAIELGMLPAWAVLSKEISSQLPSYLGQIATRSLVKTSFASANKQVMTRSFHYARDNITSLQLVFSNWYMKTTTPCAETAPGAASTVTASVEYPEGVFTQVKFSTANTGNIPDGQDLISDAALVVIPKGSKFWIRNYQTNTAGIVFSTTGTNLNLAGNKDTCQFGVSGVPDQTMGGNINNTGGNVVNPPTAILAQTKRRSFLLLGDSRTAGVNDSSDDGDRGISARPVSGFGYINLGSPTERATEFVTTGSSRRVSYGQYVSDIICGYGVNDIMRGSRTQSQLTADIQAIRSLFPTKRFYQLTINPDTTGSWADAASQVLRAQEPIRSAFNTALMSGSITGLTSQFNITTAVEDAANPGKWKSPGFTTDGIHESQLANVAIRDSGAISF